MKLKQDNAERIEIIDIVRFPNNPDTKSHLFYYLFIFFCEFFKYCQEITS